MSRHFCKLITFRQHFRYYLIYILILLPCNYIWFTCLLIDYTPSLLFHSYVGQLAFLQCAYMPLHQTWRNCGSHVLSTFAYILDETKERRGQANAGLHSPIFTLYLPKHECGYARYKEERHSRSTNRRKMSETKNEIKSTR